MSGEGSFETGMSQLQKVRYASKDGKGSSVDTVFPGLGFPGHSFATRIVLRETVSSSTQKVQVHPLISPRGMSATYRWSMLRLTHGRTRIKRSTISFS
jgi:hypothetical protein